MLKFFIIYMKTLLSLMLMLLGISLAYSHSGRTNSEGCHNNTKTGGYHCHNNKLSPKKNEYKNINKRQNKNNSNSNLNYLKKQNKYYENLANYKFCKRIKGNNEIRHKYKYYDKNLKVDVQGIISIDCETSNYVYEGGLDKRSSLDSVQQAIFAGIITGKTPAVVIYDTDNKLGRYEYRIKQVANKLRVKFQLVNINSL